MTLVILFCGGLQLVIIGSLIFVKYVKNKKDQKKELVGEARMSKITTSLMMYEHDDDKYKI